MKKTDIEIPTIEDEKALDLYQGNRIKTVVEQICKEVNSLVLDPTDPQDYKAFGSIQRKISSAKTLLDKRGEELVKPLKDEAKKIDKQRKYVKDTLDRLRRDFLAPRDELDQKEEKRKKYVEDTFEWLNHGHLKLGGPLAKEKDFEEAVAKVAALEIDPEVFGDRTEEAEKARDTAEFLINTRLDQWREEQELIEAGRKAKQQEAAARKEASAVGQRAQDDQKPKDVIAQSETHRKVLSRLIDLGLTEVQGKSVIAAIYHGKIENLKIVYDA